MDSERIVRHQLAGYLVGCFLVQLDADGDQPEQGADALYDASGAHFDPVPAWQQLALSLLRGGRPLKQVALEVGYAVPVR